MAVQESHSVPSVTPWLQVTGYASTHPGGIGVLLEHAGLDATDSFEDVGHSDDARELMAGMQIGVLGPREPPGSACRWKHRLVLPVAAVAAVALAFVVVRLTRRS